MYHQKILDMINNKISFLKENNGDITEIEKFETIQKLYENKYVDFFNQIPYSIAIQILKDLGVDEKEVNDFYTEIMKESLNKKFILKDKKSLEGGER